MFPKTQLSSLIGAGKFFGGLKMATDDLDDLEALRKRIKALEFMVESILASDLPWDILDDELSLSKRTTRRGPQSPFSDQLLYLFDRYRYREGALTQILIQHDELRSMQVGLDHKLTALAKDIADQVEQTGRQIELLETRTRSGSAELHQWLAIQTLGLVQHETRITRYIPMRAYLSDIPENGLAPLTEAINDLVETFGFELSDEFPEVLGSWFKKWFVRTKEVASQPEVAIRLAKVERAIEIGTLVTPQAEIDSKQVGAVAALNTSLADVSSAAIQVGSLLYLKLTIDGQSVVQARTLNQRELIVLENNQDLLNSPTTILSALAKFCAKDSKFSNDVVTSNVATGRIDAQNIWEVDQQNRNDERKSDDLPIVPHLPYSSHDEKESDEQEKFK
jgi:hypothetical protein